MKDVGEAGASVIILAIRSLDNYLSCYFREIVLSREWSLSGRDLG